MKKPIIMFGIVGAAVIAFMCLVLFLIGFDILALEVSHYPNRATKAYKLPAPTMEPTVKKGDRIIALKYKEAGIEPKRFDIAVFTLPNGTKPFLKRIIGLPDETLEIKNGKVIINKKELPLPGKLYYYNAGDFGKEGNAIHIPVNCYYVLGDNSANSKDSRYYGFVSRENITAKAIRIYWPINRARKLADVSKRYIRK